MEFKVFESSGTQITATEGAVMNKLFSKNEAGIVRGRLDDFQITNTTSKLTISSGHIVVSGLNLVLEEGIEFDVTPTSELTTYYLVAHIVAANQTVTAELMLLSAYNQGELDFTNEVLSGTKDYVLATVVVTANGIQSVSKIIDYIVDTERHLYEHCIIVANSAQATQATDFAIFSVLSQSPVPFASSSEVAAFLYNRGNNSNAPLKASGRHSDDSFSYVMQVDFANEDTYDGYCDSPVVGVYGNSNSELMFVIVSLEEDASAPMSYVEISGTTFNDEVITIF